jgi:outer membrane protein assembly factor BamD (BamD/ComL family)
MVEAYQSLNMPDLANEALMVLTTNYPDHDSLDNAGQLKRSKTVKSREKSWLNIITFGLMG